MTAIRGRGLPTRLRSLVRFAPIVDRNDANLHPEHGAVAKPFAMSPALKVPSQTEGHVPRPAGPVAIRTAPGLSARGPPVPITIAMTARLAASSTRLSEPAGM